MIQKPHCSLSMYPAKVTGFLLRDEGTELLVLLARNLPNLMRISLKCVNSDPMIGNYSTWEYLLESK